MRHATRSLWMLLAPLALALPATPARAQTTRPAAPRPGREARVVMPRSKTFLLLYVPTDYSPAVNWPIIFCYHGYKGKATTWPFRQVTGGKGHIVVGMNYATTEYGETCRPDKLGGEKACFNEAVEIVSTRLNVNMKLAFMGGFSQGGYSTSALGERLLDRLAGLVILGAARPYGRQLPPRADAIRGKPVFIGVGKKDDPHRARALAAVTFYKRLGADVTYESWPDLGHTINTSATNLGDWLLANGSLHRAQARLAAARQAEKDGRIAPAYLTYLQLARLSDTHPACKAAAQAARPIAERVATALAAARRAAAAEHYPAAARTLVEIAVDYEGTDFARRAAELLESLAANPAAAAAIAQAKINHRAAALEARADAADRRGDVLEAVRLYERYVAEFAKADRFGQVKARLAALRADKRTAAARREKQAAGPCKRWLSLARSYASAGADDKARVYLNMVVEQYGDTSWGDKARALLAEIGSGRR